MKKRDLLKKDSWIGNSIEVSNLVFTYIFSCYHDIMSQKYNYIKKNKVWYSKLLIYKEAEIIVSTGNFGRFPGKLANLALLQSLTWKALLCNIYNHMDSRKCIIIVYVMKYTIIEFK